MPIGTVSKMLRRRCSLARRARSVCSRSLICTCSCRVRSCTACSVRRVRPVMTSSSAASAAANITPVTAKSQVLATPAMMGTGSCAQTRSSQRRSAKFTGMTVRPSAPPVCASQPG